MAIGGEFTLRLLRDANIGPGMRVLDVGCGHGDVSLLAASLVGPDGEVVGVDRNADVLAQAQARIDGEAVGNIRLLTADLHDLPRDLSDFDAIVGRRVLMYVPQPHSVLEALRACLVPQGVMAFHEHDCSLAPYCPQELPLHTQVQTWLHQTLKHEGADLQMGFNLYGALTKAGLVVEDLRAEAILQTARQPYPVEPIVRAMIPRITAHGVATEAQIDIETLGARLEAERAASDTAYLSDMMFGVLARKAA